jgi:hypothetical protein
MRLAAKIGTSTAYFVKAFTAIAMIAFMGHDVDRAALYQGTISVVPICAIMNRLSS